MKTRPIGNKFSEKNFETFFDTCHRTAACLEYTLHLDTQLCETFFCEDTSYASPIESAIAMTYKKCFSVLVPDYCFYGISNQPGNVVKSPQDNWNFANDSDPFWKSVYSQCILSTYDTIVQLLNDSYLNINGLIGRHNGSDEHIASKGVHENFDPQKGFVIPACKSDCAIEKSMNINMLDHIRNVYTALLYNKDALSICGANIDFATNIDYDNNYHRLALPNDTLKRYFQNPPIKLRFKYKLKGPECSFVDHHIPEDYMETSNPESNQTSFEWTSSKIDLPDFPYARQTGTYKFSLTIEIENDRRKSNNAQNAQTISGTIHISRPVITSTTLKTKIYEASSEYKDLKSATNSNNSISIIEYFPMNLFNGRDENLFLFHNADFCSYFLRLAPLSTSKIISMLCADQSDKKKYRYDPIDFSNLRGNKQPDNLPSSSDKVDELYLQYQLERMTGCIITNKFFDIQKLLSSHGIIINDDELETLCQIGASRNIFSRNFLLTYILHPLFTKKGFNNNALDGQLTGNNPVSFHPTAYFTYSRDQWHAYTKMFLALWNNFIIPACEWFFFLNLLRCYDINFNDCFKTTSKGLAELKDKMRNIYNDLSNYIRNHHATLENPISIDCLANIKTSSSQNNSSNDINRIPYTREKIMFQIAKHNKMNVLNLSQSEGEPVFLKSLVNFNKDTLLSHSTENTVLTHLNQIRQTYTHFLYEQKDSYE